MWNTNKIGFHLENTNQLLIDNFPNLKLEKGSRIFIPLCGKTVDIQWLLVNGYQVVGAELSELAIKDLFLSLDITPNIEKKDSFIHYSAPNIDIYVGDIFHLDKKTLGSVDAIYDRAAIVALHENLRIKYTQHLRNITNNIKQLLITLEYDQSLMQGPPFSVTQKMLEEYYSDVYSLTFLDIQNDTDFGAIEVKEKVWLLN